jgi:hypothetical protein
MSFFVTTPRRFSARLKHLLFSAAALGAVALSTTAAQTTSAQNRLRDIVGKDALVYVDAPDFQGTLKRGAQIPLARILREEEVQQFLTPLWHAIRGQIDQGLQRIGEKPEAWTRCPLSAFELAFGSLSEKGLPVLAAKIDCGQVGDLILRLLARPENKQFAQVEEFNGVRIVTSPMNDNAALVVQPGGLLLVVGSPMDEMDARAHAKNIVTGLKGEKPKQALATSPEFMNLNGRLQSRQSEWIAYMRPAKLINMILASAGMGGPASRPRRGSMRMFGMSGVLEVAVEAANRLGLADLDALILSENYSESGVSSEMAVLIPPGSPVVKAFFGGGTPADRAFLDKAVDGVDAFRVGTFDPKHIYKTIEDTCTAAAANDKNFVNPFAVLAEFEAKAGVKFYADLFESIGPEYYYYAFPPKSSGGGVPTFDSFYVLRAKDRVKVEKVLSTLAAVVNDAKSKEVEVVISEPTANRPAVYTLQAAANGRPGGNPMVAQLFQQFALSLALVDDWVIVSTNPVALKTELRNMKKPRDASPDVKKLLASMPADAVSLSYVDWRPMVRTVWDTLASLAGLAGGVAANLPINLQEIPSSQAIVKHLKVSTSYWVLTKDGLYGRSNGSFGLELVGTAAGIGGSLAVVFQQARQHEFEARMEELEHEAESQPAHPETDATRNAKTAETLMKLQGAIRLYKTEKGGFPESLEALLIPNDDHPQGYLPGMTRIPSDAEGRPFHYDSKTGAVTRSTDK